MSAITSPICYMDCLHCVYDDCKIENRYYLSERKYRDKHSEHYKELYRTRYYNNRERLVAESKAYYQAHKEERLAYAKKYREAHKDERSSKWKEYYAKHKDEINAKKREKRGLNKERKMQKGVKCDLEKVCSKCKYRGKISGTLCCDYILITKGSRVFKGEKRRIEPGYCDEFEEGEVEIAEKVQLPW